MRELNKPSKRTFWKAVSADATSVVHQGVTEMDQETTTGQPVFTTNTNATSLFTALPTAGTSLTTNSIYSYSNGMVRVIQDHIRTTNAPNLEPDNFDYYRSEATMMLWIAGEVVGTGCIRSYNAKVYKCLQTHKTNVSNNPEITLGTLWTQ